MNRCDDDRLIQILRDGGVILCPTDTIWGLSCDVNDDLAIDRIFAIKQRPKEKSLLVLMSSENMLADYGITLTETQKKFMSEATKPVTMIFDGVQGVSNDLYHADGSLGIRIVVPRENNPGSQWCHAFIEAYGKPIVSTSANITGHVSPAIFSQISQDITEDVDGAPLFEDSDSTNEPSQIVRVYSDGEVDVLRS